METGRKIEILRRAVAAFGPVQQTDMMIEEMSELTKALCKYRRAVSGGADETELSVKNDQILEELADVQIMVHQMVLIYGSFEAQEAYKLERLERRLDERKAAEA